MAVGGACIAAPEAHAYLDPGSGSMLLQILLGGLAGAGVLAKLYWHRIRELFGARDGEEQERGREWEPGREQEREREQDEKEGREGREETRP